MSGQTAVAERGAAWRFVPPALSPEAAYTARTVLAAVAALYAAYVLELDAPYSAATTVVIVSNPVRGAIFSKSLFRVLGTLIGAAIAVVLVAAFAQAPVLFLIATAVWLGVCTFVASLLRHFRAYAAVLAGYTITLVAFGAAIQHPDEILQIALARVAVVTLGVAAAGLASLFQPVAATQSVDARTGAAVSSVAAFIRAALDGGVPADLLPERSRIARLLAGMDETVEFGAAESFDVARRAPQLRAGIALLFSALTGALRAVSRVEALASVPRTQPLAAGLYAALLALAQAAEHQPHAATMGAEAAAFRHRMSLLRSGCDDVRALTALDAVEQFGTQLTEAIALLHAPPGALRDALPLWRWHDWRTALRNGVRAAVALTLAGFFWMATAWPSGGAALTQLGVMCALLATNDSAARASVGFAAGTALSVLFGFVCVFGVLPQISGFPLLGVTVAVFLAPGVYASTNPDLARVATPYLIFFITLAGVTNPMHYSIASFLNVSVAFLLGQIGAALVFRILLPPSEARDVRQAMRAIAGSVARVARGRAIPDALAWEHMQHQKLLRISTRLPPDPQARARVIGDAAALVLAGREVLRVRAAERDGVVPESARVPVRHALACLARVASRPERAAHAAGAAARAVMRARPGRAPKAARALREIQILLETRQRGAAAC